MNPRISVIMPVLNGEKYLKEAIDSILAQTFADFEFIIIDDGSTDATESIITSYDDNRIIRIKNPENFGLSKSFNIGIQAARGTYIARMDADDIAMPERFEKEVAFLAAHPDIDIVGSAIRRIDETGKELGISRKALEHKALTWQSLFSIPMIHPTVMGKADIFKANPYDEHIHNSEDYELWSRLIFDKGVRIANLPEPLLSYRIFPGSFTQSLSSEKRLNSVNNSLKNIERYVPLSSRDKELFEKAVTNKLSLPESFAVLNLYRKIRREFIARESFTPSLKPLVTNLLKQFLK